MANSRVNAGRPDLQESLAWAQKVRSDPGQSTTALQLADTLIEALEKLLETEDVRQAQLDRFFGVTELEPAHG